MALRKEVQERIAQFSGQKSTLPNSLLAASDAVQLKNFVTRKGSLRKIWGGTVYAQPVLSVGSGAVRWIDRYKNRWMIQQGSVVAIETGEATAAITTELATDLTTTASFPDGNIYSIVLRSDKWRDTIFLVNGKDVRQYNATYDSALVSIGLRPPGNGVASGSQPALSFTNVGAGNVPANTSYIITWYDSERGVESLPNGAAVGADGLWTGKSEAATGFAANREVQIDISAIKAAGYDTTRVTGWFAYRQDANGVYKKVSNTATAIATSTLNDNVADSGLGEVLDETISAPPSGTYYLTLAGSGLQGANAIGPRFVKFWRDQLWLFGATFPGNDLGYLPVKSILYGSEVQNPDYYPYAFDVARSDDEEDTGLAEWRNTLIVFKTRSIHYLDGTAPDNYVVRKLDSQRGCIAPGSIQETPKGIIALSSDGFILVDGFTPAQLISDPIFDEVQGINFDQLQKITSGYDLREGKYECHVPVGANTNNSKVFIFDINQGTWSFRTKAVGASVKYDLNSDNQPVSLLGDLANSRVYSISDVDQPTFNGQTIIARFASKHFDFGHSDKQKRLCFVKIKGKAITDFKINLDIIMDFGDDTISFEDIESESVFSTWAESATDSDGMVWDQDNWAGALVERKFEIQVSGIATNFQIVITESQSSANRAGFQIDEIVLEANLLGR